MLLAGAALWAVLQFTGKSYAGWITGLVPQIQGSSLIAFDQLNNEQKPILTLPEVAPDNYGAVSPDGKYAAYTQWNGAGTVRYLVVEKLTGFKKSKEYFKDVSGMQEITCISWYPDSRRLLFIRKDVTEPYPYQEICTFNITTGKLNILDSGGIWDGRAMKELNGKTEWVDYISQEQLNQLVSRYGSGSMALNDIGPKIWVDFSAPSVAPDGKRVVYSATLLCSSADESRNIRFASGIWVAGEGLAPRRIYANPDQSYSVGEVIWSSFANDLAFTQCNNQNEESRIDLLDLSSHNIKTIVHATREKYTNLGLLDMPNSELSFLSIPAGYSSMEGKRYVINMETGEIRPQDVNLSSRGNQLLNFSNLR